MTHHRERDIHWKRLVLFRLLLSIACWAMDDRFDFGLVLLLVRVRFFALHDQQGLLGRALHLLRLPDLLALFLLLVVRPVHVAIGKTFVSRVFVPSLREVPRLELLWQPRRLDLRSDPDGALDMLVRIGPDERFDREGLVGVVFVRVAVLILLALAASVFDAPEQVKVRFTVSEPGDQLGGTLVVFRFDLEREDLIRSFPVHGATFRLWRRRGSLVVVVSGGDFVGHLETTGVLLSGARSSEED